ncbi:protein starmaker [Punica granatum]|uniref:Protein starmaker n=1 Tax=Punica granatum TaxID=22663 RepID=A0A6P8BQH2_PUNGR|nr:protein starmaker [Punica granatum]
MAEVAAEVRHMPMRVRIFVGGLGERVTEEELRSIFESKNLGRVEGVDIVRTKGRSFAYCDFVPSSSASLSKLFSTYNGCVWKGGRLKLEKAKEHFLLRLEREWEEDAAMSRLLNDASGADEVPEQPQKPKKSFNPKSEIQIFFPRLRKVKTLLLKGTGKHKYSFQRVEPLPYPKHFCDCEEHLGPSSLPSIEQRIPKPEALDGGIDAKEFDLMRSVMNKLFEKEMGSATVQDEKKLAEQEVVEGMNIDEPQQEDAVEEDSGEDEDGLVINIVRSSRSTRPKMNKIEDEMSIPKRQKSELARDESGRNSLKVQKSDKLSFEKSVRPTPDVSGVGEELSSFSTHKEKKPKDQSETRAKWSQRSSWRELLGDKTKSSFTVSHILTGSGSSKEEEIGRDQEESGDHESEESDEHDDEESDEHEDEESAEHDDEESDGHGSLDNEDHESNKLSDVADSVDSEDHEFDKHSDLDDSVDCEDHELDKRNVCVEADLKESNPVLGSKSGRGAMWLHKSSWTQLVADSQNQSFSLSRILPPDRNEETQDYRDDTAVTNNKQRGNEPSNALVNGKEEAPITSSLGEEPKNLILQSSMESNPGTSLKREKNGVATAEKVPLCIGEECLFMRSSASLRDWAKSKAALTGSRKRKKI